MNGTEAAERVRAALATGTPPVRKDLEHALRECFGMTARQAKRFTSSGAKAIGAADDGIEDLMERVKALEFSLRK